MKLVTPLEQFKIRAQAHPDKPYLHYPKGAQWHTLNWAEVDDTARRIAAGLLAQGCEKGDRVAILGKNSAEWVIADLAIMMAGLISVPIYASAGEDMLTHILEHSDTKVVFVGHLDDYAAAKNATAQYTSVNWADTDNIDSDLHWSVLAATHPLSEYELPDPSDIYTISYTSGSSGLAKGVVITHANIGWQALHFRHELLLKGDIAHRALSYLPLAHITERSTIWIASIYNDLELYFNEGLSTFMRDLQKARPTLFISVPRLWVKFQAGVLSKMEDKVLQRKLKIPVLGKFLGYMIRKKLGLHHVIYAGCGSAPVSPDTLLWYQRLGLNVSEGWGMTETCGAACMNLPFQDRFMGTIGKPLNGFDMKLSETNEILIRGKAIFTEYYKDAEATEKSFVDGWFRTGDKGWCSEEGAWKITGRENETFKTAKGKFVNPVTIERKLAIDTHIEQCCVVGQGRSQPMALVVLNESISGFSDGINQSLRDTIEIINSSLEPHERIDCLLVCKDPWTIADSLLTPTLKLKRDNIKTKYRDYFDKDLPNRSVIWE